MLHFHMDFIPISYALHILFTWSAPARRPGSQFSYDVFVIYLYIYIYIYV